MLALFDTNIYIGLITDRIRSPVSQQWEKKYVVRLSPVVYHELLRGAKDRSIVYKIRKKTTMIQAPTIKIWEEGAEVLRQLMEKFRFNEQIFKLQNDVLLALTARHSGALVISQDKHFLEIARIIPFHLLHYQQTTQTETVS